MSVRRVAYVSAHGCPLASPGVGTAGGMSVVLRNVACALERAGIRVDVFTGLHGPCPSDAGETACGPPGSPPLRIMHLDASDPDGFARRLLACAEAGEAQYDLVHSHYWLSGEPGLLLARRLGAPHVFMGHTIAEIKERAGGAPESAVRKQAESAAVRESAAVVTATEEEAAAVSALFEYPADRVHAVPLGVDSSLFRPLPRVEARSSLGIGADEKVALFVGRTEPFKGPDVLIQALALLRRPGGVRLLIVGGERDGAEAQWLRDAAWASGVSGRIDVRGAAPHGDLPRYYAAADVCVAPSLHETFGLVALEAMACGTPVAASRAGGLRQVVRAGETGVLFEPGDPRDLAAALDALLDDPAGTRRMGEAGVPWARTFTWEAAAARMAAVYARAATAN